MKKIAITVIIISLLVIGQAWGTLTTIGFHGIVGQNEDRISVDIFPLTFSGELTYEDSDFSIINIELTRMYVNAQRLYGGWIGEGFSNAYLSTTNGEIIGISAAFEWNDRFYTDPDMAPDSEIHGYQPWFDLILLPPDIEVIAYRDPPAGLYENYEKRFLDDYDFYMDHGIGYAGIRYAIDEKLAAVFDIDDNNSSDAGRTISGWGIYDIDAAPVPEPTTMILFAAGLAALSGLGRKNIR